MKKAVHLPEREQFEFLISKWNPKEQVSESWEFNGHKTCILIESDTNDIGGRASVEYMEAYGIKTLTFSEWLKENNFEKEWEESRNDKIVFNVPRNKFYEDLDKNKPWVPVNGDLIQCSYDGIDWFKTPREFVAMVNGEYLHKHKSKHGTYLSTKYARPLKQSFTLSEAKAIIAETKNLNIENIEIV